MSDGYSNANHAWLSGTGSRSSFTGGGTGWDVGTAVGIEHDLGGAAGIGCGNLAIGVFGDFGGFGSSSAASKVDGTAKGGGVYAKAASQSGFYASVLAGVNWNDANLTNGALNSTAKQSSRSTLVTASVGVTHDVTDSIALDARAFGSIAHTNGDGFTDSSGFAVTGTSTDITSYGFLLGLNADVTSNTTAFVRGGVKWLNVDQSATAYGTTVSGQSDAFVKSLEAGFTSQLSDSAVLSGSAFGDWTTGSNSYGGNLSIAFKL
jgi:Autotransporter beta-domain